MTALSLKPSTKKIMASGSASNTAPVTAVPWPSFGSSRIIVGVPPSGD